MFDVVSIGSATADVFVHIPKTFSNKDLCVFHPGTKVEIEAMEYFTGGGATNTSVAFSRLGLKTGALCAVGDDASGIKVLNVLKKEKVSTSFVNTLLGKNTSYSVILTGFGKDRVVLCYSKATASLGEAKLNFAKLNAKWFYITSLHSAPALLKNIILRAKKKKVKIAWNPGQKELSLGFKKLKQIVGLVDILIVNKEEALKLTGSADIHRNLKKLLELAETVVITDGKHGAYAANGAFSYSVKTFNISPLDVTGAGDAFGSGFTAAMIKGKGIDDALVYGTANSNSVIGHLGTKNILLTEQGLKVFLKKYGVPAVKRQKL
ncbi:MAG: carbohydrate kinase family protein [archaeon]|nr:carbohydrate kinase family protein [archaeon]